MAAVLRSVSSSLAALTELGSRARHARVFHPVGEAFEAEVVVDAGDHPLESLRGEYPATARLSRGIGMPTWAPDLLGLAVRVHDLPDGDQDLLLVSAGRRFPFRHLLRPAFDPARPTYSSLVRFETASGQRVTIGASAIEETGRNYSLLVASSTRPWTTVGALHLGQRLDEDDERDLRFDPWAHASALRPVGALNALRQAAYPASQRGRARATSGRRTGGAGRPGRRFEEERTRR